MGIYLSTHPDAWGDATKRQRQGVRKKIPPEAGGAGIAGDGPGSALAMIYECT